jgi:hypothetical protein
MEEVDVSRLLVSGLFESFRQQLKKDFESAGIAASFADKLPQDLDLLKNLIAEVIPFSNQHSLSALLYRVDISEQQLRNYGKKNVDMTFNEIVTELIIKRVLQKVILKRTYSSDK